MRCTGLPNSFKVMLAIILSISFAQEKAQAAKCPCDIYKDGGTPCVAAHSTVRALYSTYNGPLYQVRRLPDTQNKKDIYPRSPGGVVNAGTQDSFLGSSRGTISIIYDQSENANHLKSHCSGTWTPPDTEAVATDAPIKINGYKAYGVLTYGAFTPNVGTGYRNNVTKGVPTGNPAEGMYMVASGRRYNQWCCFDYGNAESNGLCNGKATMECIYFGNSTQWGHGSGSGPWIMADMENGMVAGGDYVDNNNATIAPTDFVSLMLKGGGYTSTVTNWYSMKAGNAQSGKLDPKYSGTRPSGYYPMKLDGAIILGIGGDNSHTGVGTFFEGAMTKGCPSDAVEDSIQANIIAAGYGSNVTFTRNNGMGALTPPQFKVKYNPSNGNAVIEYSLHEARRVSMNMFDGQGRRVAEIVNGAMVAGRHTAVWNAKGTPAGVYVWKFAIDGSDIATGKISVGK